VAKSKRFAAGTRIAVLVEVRGRLQMLRSLWKIVWLPAVLALLSGCNWGALDLNGLFDFSPHGLEFVPKRFALGSAVVTAIEASGPSPVVSAADPDIIRVERIDASHVQLSAIGVGATTITVEDDGRVAEYLVEVAVQERHEVLLVERGWGLVPVVAINEKAFLSDVPHQIVVALYDSKGLLFGSGLSRFTMPERSQECARDSGVSFDGRCMILEEGLHVMHVDVAGQEENVVFGAVSEQEIVDILLLPSKEEEDAEPDELIQVNVLGLTESGTRVYGLPEVLTTPSTGIPGPFAYQFGPSSPVQLLTVETLGFEAEIAIHGSVALPQSLEHDCWSSRFFGCLGAAVGVVAGGVVVDGFAESNL
jgi:hypothetical protein